MKKINNPNITIVVPSLNQGKYLDMALSSIFNNKKLQVEVFIEDGGSTDCTHDIIRKWEHKLSGWRSCNDKGQSNAINMGIKKGTAPFVTWLNSDDYYLYDGLNKLYENIKNTDYPAIYGRTYDLIDSSKSFLISNVEPFNPKRLALRCIVSQPGALIKRKVWESLNGVDESLEMSMDYDLWWKIYKNFGNLLYIDDFVAINRVHHNTKSKKNYVLHYKESIQVVKKYNTRVPLKWIIIHNVRRIKRYIHEYFTCI